MRTGKWKVGSTAAALLTAVVAQARWIDGGVGAAWGTTPAEAAAAFVPWDDEARTRATFGTVGLAVATADSNTVTVAGAGIAEANGVYALDYEDEYSVQYSTGGGAYLIAVTKGEPWAATLMDGAWSTLYECGTWPAGWTMYEGVGVEPAPSVAYAVGAVTNEVGYAKAATWDAAVAWGNHASAGYLTAESDPAALHLDQGTPQTMSGFPLVQNAERIGGGYVVNDYGYNQADATGGAALQCPAGTFSMWAKTTTSVMTSYSKFWVQAVTLCEFVQESGNVMAAYVWPKDGSSTRRLVTAGGMNDGAWHNYTCTWVTNVATLYLDGVAVASGGCSNVVGKAGNTFTFGYSMGTARCFVGSMDGVSLWTNALAASEVRDLYLYGIDSGSATRFPSTGTAVTNNLLRAYRFDEVSGSSFAEVLGGATGTFVSGVSWATGGPVRSVVGAGDNAYLQVVSDLDRPLNVGRGVFRVGNAEATTQLLGGLAVGTLHAAPASATAAGLPGDIRIAAGGIYVCTATNAWVKAALATW